MTLLSLCECPLKRSTAADASNYTTPGKIELLAVAAAGIYCQFKSVTSLPEEDAVSKI